MVIWPPLVMIWPNRRRFSTGSLGRHYLIEPVEQFPERQGRNDVAVTVVALLCDEARGPVLAVDGPFGMLADEALLPDDLINRQ
jgi:hypothetical protein